MLLHAKAVADCCMLRNLSRSLFQQVMVQIKGNLKVWHGCWQRCPTLQYIKTILLSLFVLVLARTVGNQQWILHCNLVMFLSLTRLCGGVGIRFLINMTAEEKVSTAHNQRIDTMWDSGND
jgi:hypothetical protein